MSVGEIPVVEQTTVLGQVQYVAWLTTGQGSLNHRGMFRTRSSGLYRGMEISMLKSLFVAFAVLFVFQPVLVRAEEDANECMARYSQAAKNASNSYYGSEIEKRGVKECYEKKAVGPSNEIPTSADNGMSILSTLLPISIALCAFGFAIIGRVSRKERSRLIALLTETESREKKLAVELKEVLKRVDVEMAKQNQLKVAVDEMSLRLKLNRAFNGLKYHR